MDAICTSSAFPNLSSWSLVHWVIGHSPSCRSSERCMPLFLFSSSRMARSSETQLREVAELVPDLWDRGVELTEGDRSALLQADHVVRHCEVGDELRGGAHPYHVRRLVIDHQRRRRRQVVRQPVPIAQLWA